MPDKRVDMTRRQAILDSQVNSENPVINQMLDPSFATMGDVDATKLAILLSQFLNNQQIQQEQINRILEKVEKREQEAKKFEEDRQKWLQEQNDAANRLRATGDRKARLVAKGANMYQSAYKEAVAKHATNKLQLSAKIAAEPTIEVTSPGVVEMRSVNGEIVPTMVAEEIRLAHLVWYLPPGVPTKIPVSAAKVYLNNKALNKENQERKNILSVSSSGSPQYEQRELQKRWSEINRKYNAADDMVMY